MHNQVKHKAKLQNASGLALLGLVLEVSFFGLIDLSFQLWLLFHGV
jgi:hypothetical protein